MKVNFDSNSIIKFSDFIRLLSNCFKAFFGADVTLCAAYPKINTDSDVLGTPLITYKYSKVPMEIGSVTKNTEFKPRLRFTETIQTDDGESLQVDIFGKMFSYGVMFEVWGIDGKEAEDTTEKFEEFMNCYTEYFRSQGVANIVFQRIDPDQNHQQWRSDLIRRCISYQVVIDEVTSIQQTNIKSIAAELSQKYIHSFDVLSSDMITNI